MVKEAFRHEPGDVEHLLAAKNGIRGQTRLVWCFLMAATLRMGKSRGQEGVCGCRGAVDSHAEEMEVRLLEGGGLVAKPENADQSQGRWENASLKDAIVRLREGVGPAKTEMPGLCESRGGSAS